LRQIEELRKSPDWAEQSATLFQSEMIQTLRLERFKLEREEADLAIDLGDKHPRIINIRAEISGVKAKLQRELEQFIQTARDELAEARARETALKRSLDSMTNQVGDLNESEMRMRALEREAQANQNLYESFLARYKETSVQGEVQQPDARVIGYAQVPNAPSYPPKKRYMNTAIVLSLGLALALVFAIEKLDKGFRTVRQVEQQTGLPVLSLIPSANLNREHAKHAEDLITKTSHTRFTESINILYSHLKWPRESGIKNLILVTSAMPKEGKTSTAISLARRAAFLGDKTLLIDADFHNPLLTRRLGLQTSPGISEVVTKEASLEDALQRDEASGTFVLSCGRSKTDPVALIGSERFRELLMSFKETFDLVVLDSSPILAVAEPAILARTVDQTLVLVRWGKTPRSASLAAVKQLRDFGARIAGVTLTQVDLNRQSYYGYGEYGYYTKQMKGYYTS
jgi:capsular exopolysaccharide synthesis family protein